MSSFRRVIISDRDQEPGAREDEDEGVKTKMSLGKYVEPSMVVDSEPVSESDREEEQRKRNDGGKQLRLPKHQQQREREQDEEVEDETDSDSESESDLDRKPVPPSTSKTVNKGTKAKGSVKVPLVLHTISRERDSNGANGMRGDVPNEEPSTKKTKHAAGNDDKTRSQAEKSPAKRDRRAEQAARGSMKPLSAASAKAEKALPTVVALPASNAKAQTAGRKRKVSSPAPAGVSARQQQAAKVDGDKSPPKPKKPFSWNSVVEDSLVDLLFDDYSNGVPIPATKVDPYWEKLLKRLPLEEELTGLQLWDKVKRMKQRYHTLKDRSNIDGAKLFKSLHEEKMYQLWTQIWGDSGTKIPQPAVAVEHSDDESAEASPVVAPRESSKRAARQSNGELDRDDPIQGNGEVSNRIEPPGKGKTLISDDEGEKEIELTRQEPGMSQMNAASKQMPEPVLVTPFISKPRLNYTPRLSKEDKLKPARKGEDVCSGDQPVEDAIARDHEEKDDGVSSDTQHLKQFKSEMIGFFQDLRTFFPGIEAQSNGTSTGELGQVAHLGLGFRVFVSGVLEGLGAGTEGHAARELQKRWRELKIQELDLVSKRLHLMQEHCRLQQEDLKLQSQILDE